MNIDDMPLCQEVTFEIFEERFMNRYYKFMTKSLARKLSPSFIWTEIMSVIKGSLSENSSISKCLCQSEYLSRGSVFLTRSEKYTVYYLYLQYENWKLNVRAFDFLDVVNHVMFEMMNWRGENYKCQQMDFLIIDEVQDLHPKTAYLLLKQTHYKVVFAGDTAQTIAKGVSARISDLDDVLTRKMQLKSD